MHPDVRRTLLSIRAFNEAARALAIQTALYGDLAHRSQDPKERQHADDMMGLLTPVVKGVLTDIGFANTVNAQQIYGGHGYIAEWGMEQFVRDARIPMIYEGANGIQALDLVGRKLAKDGGRAVMAFFAEVQGFVNAHRADEAMKPIIEPLDVSLGHLQAATMWFMNNALKKPDNAGAGASDLHAHVRAGGARPDVGAHCTGGEREAARRAMRGGGALDAQALKNKLIVARFFGEKMLPETAAQLKRIEAGAGSVMEMGMEGF